jgi:hypothetical protein
MANPSYTIDPNYVAAYHYLMMQQGAAAAAGAVAAGSNASPMQVAGGNTVYGFNPFLAAQASLPNAMMMPAMFNPQVRAPDLLSISALCPTAVYSNSNFSVF